MAKQHWKEELRFELRFVWGAATVDTPTSAWVEELQAAIDQSDKALLAKAREIKAKIHARAYVPKWEHSTTNSLTTWIMYIEKQLGEQS